MLDDLELSLMAFPQSWTAATHTLAVNLLVLPVGNPLGPVGSVPKFAGTTLKLNARLMTGEALPASGDDRRAHRAVRRRAAAGRRRAADRAASAAAAGTTITTGKVTAAKAPPAGLRIMKALPPSYTQAIPFSRPVDPALFVIGDGYGCAVKAQDPGMTLPKPAPTIAWGQLISYILHQPALAQACGFVYRTTRHDRAVTASRRLVDQLRDRHEQSDQPVRHRPRQSRRDPQLRRPSAATRRRSASCSRPRCSRLWQRPNSNLAGPDLEAQIYDDGFAQVVHCHQPPTVDTATGDMSGLPPGAEAGMQIGWDDEQVTVWLDRSGRSAARSCEPTPATNPEAPLGVLGYRVDVREAGATLWNPLCAVSGSLPFSGAIGHAVRAARPAASCSSTRRRSDRRWRAPPTIRAGCRSTSPPGAVRAS